MIRLFQFEDRLRDKTMLIFAMIFHFLVDALCGSTMLGCVVEDLPEKAFELVMLYNALAFATQVFTGWLADKL